MIASAMNGKAALVTGAASGLGRATALALARAGADLFLVDMKEPALAETAAAARGLGVRADILPTDLARAEACRGAVEAAANTYGRLDALCNVAGVVAFSHTPDMAEEAYQRIIAVNLSAPFFLSQAAIPHLLSMEGAIVNVASTAAFVGEAYLAAYCASKAGLVQMTKAMAMEFVHKPIRINAVAPGGMATGIVEGLKMPEGADFALIKRYSGLRGLVDVDDAASVVAHLASPAGRGFHGACVTIDRGITAG